MSVLFWLAAIGQKMSLWPHRRWPVLVTSQPVRTISAAGVRQRWTGRGRRLTSASSRTTPQRRQRLRTPLVPPLRSRRTTTSSRQTTTTASSMWTPRDYDLPTRFQRCCKAVEIFFKGLLFTPDQLNKTGSCSTVVLYVDSVIVGEDSNSTSQYDDYVNVDDDLRARDLERVVFQPVETSHRDLVTSSASRDLLYTAVTLTSGAAAGRQQDAFTFDPGLTGRRQTLYVGSSVMTLTTSTSRNSAESDDVEDWWRQFPFMGSMLTSATTTITPANTMSATSTTPVDGDVAPTTTLRSIVEQSLSTVPDSRLKAEPSTSQWWLFTAVTASRRPITTSYPQHGYVDLDDLKEHQPLDVVVRQDEQHEVPRGQVMVTSTGIVLLGSIVVASLLLLAVIVLLVFYRYGSSVLPSTTSSDRISNCTSWWCIPVGCRRCLKACGLGPACLCRSWKNISRCDWTVRSQENSPGQCWSY